MYNRYNRDPKILCFSRLPLKTILKLCSSQLSLSLLVIQTGRGHIFGSFYTLCPLLEHWATLGYFEATNKRKGLILGYIGLPFNRNSIETPKILCFPHFDYFHYVILNMIGCTCTIDTIDIKDTIDTIDRYPVQ